MVKIFIFLMACALSISSYADDGEKCKDNPRAENLYGLYHVTEVKNNSGTKIPIGKKKRLWQRTIEFNKGFIKYKFIKDDNIAGSISSPKPKTWITCHPLTTAEGEVPHHRWTSHFQGFGRERKVLKVLYITGENII